MADGLITIQVKKRSVAAALAKLLERTGNLRPAFKAMSETLHLSTDRRFHDQKDPKGNPWKPLKKSTLKHKKNSLILTETTKLRDGIHGEVGNNQFLFGSDSPYGAIHQLGGVIKQEGMVLHLKGKGRNTRFAKPGNADRAMKVNRTIRIPARPFLGISAQDEKDLVQDVEAYLLG